MLRFPVLANNHKSSLQAIQNNAIRIIDHSWDKTTAELHSKYELDRLDARANELTTRYLSGALSTNNELISELITNFDEFSHKKSITHSHQGRKSTATILDTFAVVPDETLDVSNISNSLIEENEDIL